MVFVVACTQVQLPTTQHTPSTNPPKHTTNKHTTNTRLQSREMPSIASEEREGWAAVGYFAHEVVALVEDASSWRPPAAEVLILAVEEGDVRPAVARGLHLGPEGQPAVHAAVDHESPRRRMRSRRLSSSAP